MKRQLLLPHGFQRIGVAIFIPAAIIGIAMMIDGYNGFPSYLLPSDRDSALYAALDSQWMSRLLNNIAIIGICAGCVLATCSRERVEDEMIGALRLRSLLAALYTTTLLTVAASLLLYDMRFLDFMVWNMFTLPILFMLLFRWRMYRLEKHSADEE